MYHGRTPLTLDQVRQAAPSAFATQPWGEVSSKYRFVPTSTIIEGLAKEGFQVYSAKQSRSRIEGKGEFTKHMIRLRRAGQSLVVGDTFPEVIIVNSHDRTSAYNIYAGMFRLACLNGMICSVGGSMKYSTPHSGDIERDVIEASYRIVEDFPLLADTAQAWLGKAITPAQQVAYAESAALLRWDADQAHPAASELLRVRRSDDRTQVGTLWGTYQRVQESLTKGGSVYSVRDALGSKVKRRHTRAVEGIDGDTKLNKALWSLTEKMASLI